MPLCPQITITPITVTATGMTQSSVIAAGTPPTTEQLSVVSADATAAAAAAAAAAAVAASSAAAAAAAQASATTALTNAATAQSTANAAAATAGAAQSTATTALANAATAYTTAQNSLQSSAYAIQDPVTKQLTSIDSTGLTVYSGANPTSGARVVLNSLGIAAYGTSGSSNITNAVGNGTTVTYSASGHSLTVGESITVSALAPSGYNGSFVITAISSGSTFTVANTTTSTVTDPNGVAERATLAISATTGNAVFSGSITGSTIIGGTLNIAGNATIDSAGLLTATGVTITGEIRGTSGYFGSPTNGFSISATGLTGVGTGNITGGSILGTQFTSVGGVFSVSPAGFLIATAGTIGGMTLSASSIVSATGGFSVTSAGVLTAISGSIGGFTLSSTSIYSSTNLVIETSGTITGGNSSTIFYGFANIGGGSVTGERLIVAGTSALNGNTGVLGNLSVTNSATFGAVTQQFEFLSSSGNVRVAQTYNNDMGGTTRAMRVSTTGLYGYVSSTRRRKEQIEDYAIDSQALLSLPLKKFKYQNDDSGVQQYGFIAEEAQDLGLDELIQYDSTGIPDYFAYETLPIFLLQLAQEQEARIKALEGV